MTLKICSKQFYSNYIFHPNAVELTPKEQRKALINSICLGIFTLGLCQLICLIKYRNRKFKLLSLIEDPLAVLVKHALREEEAYLIDFSKINPGNMDKVFSKKGKKIEEFSIGDAWFMNAQGAVEDVHDFPVAYFLCVVDESKHDPVNGHSARERSLLFRMNAAGKILCEGNLYANFDELMEHGFPPWWKNFSYLNFIAVGENKILRKTF